MTYLVSESDHRLSHVEDWCVRLEHVLGYCTGHADLNRIRIRSYRMGLFWDGEKIIIESIGTRGDFYKTYP